MIRAIIVDDELNNRENLDLALKDHCKSVEVVGMAHSAAGALDLISEYRPDLVFLDIAMPDGDGFDLLQSLDVVDFDVIFVTAFDHYAIKAIKFCAIDYLLKPIDILELKRAVGRVQQMKDKSLERVKLEKLMTNLQGASLKLALPQSDHTQFVNVDQVIRCRADKNYTWVYLKDGTKLLIAKTLKEYVDLLEDMNFVRVHQSHLINALEVKKYSRRDGGYVVLSDGERVPVARNRKEVLQQALDKIVRK